MKRKLRRATRGEQVAVGILATLVGILGLIWPGVGRDKSAK